MTITSGLVTQLSTLRGQVEVLDTDFDAFQMDCSQGTWNASEAERLLARANIAQDILDGLLHTLSSPGSKLVPILISEIQDVIDTVHDRFGLSVIADDVWDISRLSMNRLIHESLGELVEEEDGECGTSFHIARDVSWCPQTTRIEPFLPGHRNPKLWFTVHKIPFAHRPLRPVPVGDTALFLTKDQRESASLKTRDERESRVKFVDNLDPDCYSETPQDRDPHYDLIPQYVMKDDRRVPVKTVPDGEGGYTLST